MNERIKALAKQAECTIDSMGYGEGNLEEFAKLIIADCLTICDTAKTPDKHCAAIVVGGQTCAIMIREVFGIK